MNPQFNRLFRTTAIAAFLASWACSGTSIVLMDGPDSGHPNEPTDAGDRAEVGAGPDGALLPGDAGDAQPPPPDADAAVDRRIMPVALGRLWTFASAPLGGVTNECAGIQTSEVVGPGATRASGPSLRYRPFCASSVLYDVEGTGDRLRAWGVDSTGVTIAGPFLYLDDVSEGHQWDYGLGAKYAWHDAGTVTVPAGTFSDCWRRDGVPASDDYTIYCRGVGQVRHHYPSQGYQADLTTKNF